MASSNKNSKELIRSSLADMGKVIENETEVFLSDVHLIQQMNTSEALKSVRLQDKLESLIKDSQEIKQANNELRMFDSKLSELENQTDNLEAIAKELDQWTKELETKSKRGTK